MLLIAQPVVYKLKRVSLVVIPAPGCELPGNVLVALLEPCSVPGAHPEDVRFGIHFPKRVGVPDSNLRFTNPAESSQRNVFLRVNFFVMSSMIDCRPSKFASLVKGTGRVVGMAGCLCAAVVPYIAVAVLEPTNSFSWPSFYRCSH